MPDPLVEFARPALIRNRIVDAVRDAILHGRIRPGERIPERMLVESLGISRSPLREALRVLEAEGLVTTEPHRGARVSELSAEDLRETTDVRLMLETHAARLTCKALDGPTLDAMAAALARSRAGRGRARADLASSMGFHDVFVQACGNQKVIQLHAIVKRHLRRYQLLAFARLGRARRAAAEHARILDAFHERDVLEVERLLTAHLLHASEEIASHLAARTAPAGARTPAGAPRTPRAGTPAPGTHESRRRRP
jgi:DNA-binding GntR family transcriptional regulator